ncbi:hypothetical protein JR316_0004013 [Psilocybe cubensis]|uniref:Uncharacterized protein n=1 Tax=Psilocybe cubensis TaxID=181762 RepID=A0ACB8H9I5_PSICU|nr:hypothetical protein JR316_0004013 [Psilocybe cubensis]KAH9484531.1 hypothetical protein JR316_0004013 [Psilocybe cubensis]
MGIEATQISASPLQIKFVVKGREGAALVLPNGTSREDLADPSRIRAYVRMHLLKWYRFMNRSRIGRISVPNGSLYLVTGYDKADAWAIACGPLSYSRTGTDMSIRYQADKTPVWQDFRGMTGNSNTPSDTVQSWAVFLRGMKLAVSNSDWVRYILHEDIPELPFYNVMKTPVLGRRARLQTYIEHRYNFPAKYLSESTHSPNADVAIVDDWVWCAVADRSDGSLSRVAHLLLRILETHEIVIQDGLATLKPFSPTQSKELSVQSFRQITVGLSRFRRRSNIKRKLDKIFPGPPVPQEQFEDSD